MILATAIGLGLTAALLGLVFLHRTRRSTILTRIGNRLGKATGVPAWVALPTVLTTVSLLVALLGMLWDIALHIGVGRDEGPLANPAHYLILFGLFGVFAGGVLACSMPLDEKPGPAAVRFIRGWDVPVGGILLTGAGFYALLGFPLDDVWHRLFGQDVTLWGPTHLMLITGAGLSIIGLLVLEQEGHGGLSTDDGDRKVGRTARFVRQASAMGGLLLGLSVFQGEYDFDVPQFRLVLEPLMIAGAAGLALVAARLFIGRGGALAAAAFFLVIRGGIALIVGPGFGEIMPTFPLYLGSAIVVELLALSVPLAAPSAGVRRRRRCRDRHARSRHRVGLDRSSRRPCRGTATSSSRARSWRSSAASSAACSARLLASGLRRRLPRPAVARTVARRRRCVVLAAARHQRPARHRARRPRRHVRDRGRPGRAADGEHQRPAGPGRLRRRPGLGADHLVAGRRASSSTPWSGPARARTGRPSPSRSTAPGRRCCACTTAGCSRAVPIYLPEDEAHRRAEEIPAEDGMTRAAIPEIEILQRELKDSGGGLWAVANLVVLACTLALIAAISWGVGRYSRRASAREPFPDTPADPPADDGRCPGRQRPRQPLTSPTTRRSPP